MPKSRLGISMVLVLVGLSILALASGGAYYWLTQSSTKEVFDPITTEVTKAEFVAQVLSEGEIQSSENIEIKCEARARNGNVTVLRVVPEGTKVKGGDFLVELDSTSFEKEREQQLIAVTSANTQVIRSRSDLATAKISLTEYEEGTFKENKLKLELDLKSAEQELALAREKAIYSAKMQAKNFITQQQLRGEELAVQQAERKIELVNIQSKVLLEYTKEKELTRFRSDIQAAEVKLENDEEALLVEQRKLDEIEDLIQKCMIYVPEGKSGQVVYHKEFSRRGGTEWVLEPGAEVREGQVLIRLPNQEKMEVKALVQEQSITSVRVGMPAEIRVDALNNQVLTGVVTKVNQYPEQSGWMSTSIRKYAVIVRIINPPSELIPGMNSSVAIQTRREADQLLIPVQAVYGVQGQYFCLKKEEGRFETAEVSLKGDNSTMTVVEEGLEEGDVIVLNPGAYKEYMDLPEVRLDQAIEMSAEDLEAAKEQVADAKANPSSEEDPRLNAMFDPADTDNDGKISKEELAAMQGGMKGMLSRADADNDGFITKEEAKQFFQKMSQRGGQGGPGAGGPGGGGPGAGGPGNGGGRPGGGFGGGGRPGGGR